MVLKDLPAYLDVVSNSDILLIFFTSIYSLGQEE